MREAHYRLDVVALAQLGGCNFKQLPLLFDETHLVCACTAAQGHVGKELLSTQFQRNIVTSWVSMLLNLAERASATEEPGGRPVTHRTLVTLVTLLSYFYSWRFLVVTIGFPETDKRMILSHKTSSLFDVFQPSGHSHRNDQWVYRGNQTFLGRFSRKINKGSIWNQAWFWKSSSGKWRDQVLLKSSPLQHHSTKYWFLSLNH